MRRDFASAFRSRLAVQDGLILAAVMCAATLFAFEYDFFEHADQMTVHQRRITAQEFFVLTGFLIAGLIAFSFRRLTLQKRELTRRLAAETAANDARRQALHDALTGLPNRRALLDVMNATLTGLRSSRLHALVMLDLTGFKAINDQYGHPVGDQILQIIARRMQSNLRDGEFAARLGGDEFAVFCPNVEQPDRVRQFAHRLLASIEASIEIAGARHQVGAGAGIAFYPQDGATQQELFRSADAALYRAKESRRSTVVCRSDPDINAPGAVKESQA
jgi:diguanylate cyclase (GGDEF)-like protein